MDPVIEALQSRKAELEDKIVHLQAELQRIRNAMEALTAAELFDEMRHKRRQSGSKPVGSLKQMAYTVLHRVGYAMTANQILDEIARRFGQIIPRTSMSPQLSRLGQDGVLVRKGTLWSINPDRAGEFDRFYLIDEPGLLI